MKQRTSCSACFMPFKADPGVRENPDFCSYCYSEGKLHAEGATLKEFQDMCRQNMIKNGMPTWKAGFFAWTIRFAPYWKNKQ